MPAHVHIVHIYTHDMHSIDSILYIIAYLSSCRPGNERVRSSKEKRLKPYLVVVHIYKVYAYI